MPAARIITPPLSGRDRKHYARELHKAETAYEYERRAAELAHAVAAEALAKAYALDCIAWSTRQFIGGPEEPSPTIGQAILGKHTLLEVGCRHCRHTEIIDLALVVQPRDKPVHMMRHSLYCGRCQRLANRKRRPALVALRPSEDPQPAPRSGSSPRKKAG
jgi:hypothetical protein